MKTENWNGHEIRFVSLEGEWWAVAKDVAEALGYRKPENAVASHVSNIDKTTTLIQGTGSNYKSKATLISEFGIYDLVFSSKMEKAKEFKRWVFDVIKQLRHSAGLEGFEVFRMLDKEHQKEAMSKLSNSLADPVREHFIIANVIANKAVSTKYGFEKSLKKGDMLPEMLVDRQAILDDTAQLIAVKDKFGLDLSVSKEVYSKVLGKAHADVS
ncbi:prophage antirepressor [Listeria floridensis FSL S10-1187]|uniref:Prophage antirepressor n=1 Tax=Listeria floridensis FSL S10-1187 TaxID=1265817 RepID=A0ABP3ATE7_9LIST|nr:BRO family protein [Listeria floridensis]EUJ23458.1 prophage antirepressor [Listeria floridensis FSL S10-1187]